MIQHPIAPVYDEHSQILILGSFPSVKSRENQFFYGHPQNRFWKVLAAIYARPVPVTVDEKRRFLLSERIALWDVIGACDITGSADSSIRNVIPNDVDRILRTAHIRRIYVNGHTSEKYYNRYLRDQLRQEAVCLPSTSPANASWSLEKLIAQWSVIWNEPR